MAAQRMLAADTDGLESRSIARPHQKGAAAFIAKPENPVTRAKLSQVLLRHSAQAQFH
jgi:hypothetical protein